MRINVSLSRPGKTGVNRNLGLGTVAAQYELVAKANGQG
jgi:hypothetical protein